VVGGGHVVALMYGQLADCDSLNGIVDAAMAERLYWVVFDHLAAVCPGFEQYKRHKGFPARMKRGIFAIDSSTIRLYLNCIDWSARTIAELYRARWAVELFFKELKQTCQIRDFVGYSTTVKTG
jgi:IS4 transposase